MKFPQLLLCCCAGVIGCASLQADDVYSFNMGNGFPVVSGDVPASNNTDGLQITGQVGNWADIWISTTNATDDGVTLTFSPPDTISNSGWGGTVGDTRGNGVGTDALRIGSFLSNPGDVPWTLTGLEPGTSYDLVWYNKRVPPGENRHPNTGIDGFDAGNGVGASGPLDADRDQNFSGVVSDGTGKITGTWFLAGGLVDITAVAGVQVRKTPDKPGLIFQIR
jgi:hypothetical protein